MIGIGLLILIFSSCIRKDSKVIGEYMQPVYAKDRVTGLCFAFVKYSDNEPDSRSMTCVPCDSLKNVYIYLMKSYLMKLPSTAYP